MAWRGVENNKAAAKWRNVAAWRKREMKAMKIEYLANNRNKISKAKMKRNGDIENESK
jgi:hypothetical protein